MIDNSYLEDLYNEWFNESYGLAQYEYMGLTETEMEEWFWHDHNRDRDEGEFRFKVNPDTRLIKIQVSSYVPSGEVIIFTEHIKGSKTMTINIPK